MLAWAPLDRCKQKKILTDRGLPFSAAYTGKDYPQISIDGHNLCLCGRLNGGRYEVGLKPVYNGSCRKEHSSARIKKDANPGYHKDHFKKG